MPTLTRAVSFVVTGDFYTELTPNRYRSGWEEQRRRGKWRLLVWAAWNNAGRPTLPLPVVVTFVVRRARAVDQPNLMAALKPLLDGLTEKRGRGKAAGMLPDDSAACVREVRVEQEIGGSWRGREEVRVIVQAHTGEE